MKNPASVEQGLRPVLRMHFAAPWMKPDPQERLFQMPFDELISVYEAIMNILFVYLFCSAVCSVNIWKHFGFPDTATFRNLFRVGPC